jgi:hypothetical protein
VPKDETQSGAGGQSGGLQPTDRVVLPARLGAVLRAEIGPVPDGEELCAAFLDCRSYSSALADRLIAASRGAGGEGWDLRRLAALMVQCLVLRLPRGDLGALDRLCVTLGLKAVAGVDLPLDSRVLAEGYTTTALAGFGRELRRRLRRAERVARPLRGRATPAAAWRDFLAYARSECRLALGRYLFSPAEVVARVRGRVRLSRGVVDPFPAEPDYVPEEAAGALAALPPYEAEICARLLAGSPIYWALPATGSRVNSLVERPLGTVVLVVKPPGSDLELELKRAGRRGGGPRLGVVMRRDGEEVPYSHRLDGGSMRTMLRWEARMAALLARIYRRIHGAEAPISRTLAITTVYGVPVGDEEAHVLDYFNWPQFDGEDFPALRQALQEAVSVGREQRVWQRADLPGALGLTVEFLQNFTPAQGLLAGTSSFRLDRLTDFMLGAGAGQYLEAAAGGPPDRPREQARRLADQALEEVLGEYSPPRAAYRTHRQYVRAALAVPANRRRADRTFVALARQLGRLWGTLAAVRGGSRGESFVARNVGLKSRWERGRWRVHIVSMDHDVMNIAGGDARHFRPLETLPAMVEDGRFILGEHRADAPHEVHGALDYLQEIYGVSPRIAGAGRDALLRELRRAYRRTQDMALRSGSLSGLCRPQFVSRLRDWDAVVRRFLAAQDGARTGHHDAAFAAATARLLARRGYQPAQIEEHLQAVALHADFLARCSFLFGNRRVGRGIRPKANRSSRSR